MTSAQKKRHGLLLGSGMAFIGLDSLDLFDNIKTDIDSSVTQGEVMLTDEFEHLSQLCGPCVRSSKNKKCD